MTVRVTKKIVVGGKEYTSVEEMPPDVRALYEKAMSLLTDKDANGVPDILDGKPGAIASLAALALKGLASGGSTTITISTNVKSSQALDSTAESAPTPTIVRTVGGAGTGARWNGWVFALLLGAGILYVLRALGLIP